MAEMMAFNRRHTPRHGDNTMENRRHSLTPAAADPAAHSIGDQAHTNAVSAVMMASAPKSNSKKRREKASVSLKNAVSTTTGASSTGGERKMSGAQLRLFFLLCVALYFSVIFFADDIVRFAKWMSDEDPVVRAWQAPSKTPLAGRTTPKPAQPPGSGDRKKTAELLVVKGATQTEEKTEGKTEEKKTGNLRGGEEEKVVEGTKKAVEETKTVEPREEETPRPQPIVTREGKTAVEKEETTHGPAAEETEKPREERGEELPQPTAVEKLNTDDAPLESIEEDGHKNRGETTTEPETKAEMATETETAAVPAQSPELGLASNPNTSPPKAENERAKPDDGDADASIRLPETPQLIQAT